MSTNTQQLEKRAIKFALDEDWENAIDLNSQLLEINPNDTKAKVRLGRAYLQTKKFKDAQKLFKEVLDKDPINPIAIKNYELAKKNVSQNTQKTNGKSLIKEPGTTKDVQIEITAKGVNANTFSYGENLAVGTTKTKAFIKHKNKKIGEITDTNVIKSIMQANKNGSALSAAFVKGNDKFIVVLIESSEPVFKGEQQDVKPYMKKGSLDEPELVIESFDDE